MATDTGRRASAATLLPAMRLRLRLGVLLLAALPFTECVAAPGTPPRIPFVVGLTTVNAVSEAQGDYETLSTVKSIGKDGYRLQVSAQVPASDGGKPDDITVMRAVNVEDKARAHRVRSWFFTSDPEVFPGTVPAFSAEMLRQLADGGATTITIVDVSGLLGFSFIQGERSGTLHRVGDGREQMPMLVNGRRVMLPVIHARGTLSDGNRDSAVELYVLDDAANPLVLRITDPTAASNMLRIEYPVAESAADSIEKQLSKHQTVEIHSIYFAFNRADIRPQSERVLQEIASILREHPDWKLQIDGHTDAIGSEAANLDLSKRRAAAVKAALVGHYHIDAARLATGGHGESQPKDTNDTPKGRSHNRRVELRRP